MSIKENYGILLKPLFRLWTLSVHTERTCRNLQFVPNFSFPYPVIFVYPLLRCTIGQPGTDMSVITMPNIVKIIPNIEIIIPNIEIIIPNIEILFQFSELKHQYTTQQNCGIKNKIK